MPGAALRSDSRGPPWPRASRSPARLRLTGVPQPFGACSSIHRRCPTCRSPVISVHGCRASARTAPATSIAPGRSYATASPRRTRYEPWSTWARWSEGGSSTMPSTRPAPCASSTSPPWRRSSPGLPGRADVDPPPSGRRCCGAASWSLRRRRSWRAGCFACCTPGESTRSPPRSWSSAAATGSTSSSDRGWPSRSTATPSTFRPRPRRPTPAGAMPWRWPGSRSSSPTGSRSCAATHAPRRRRVASSA